MAVPVEFKDGTKILIPEDALVLFPLFEKLAKLSGVGGLTLVGDPTPGQVPVAIDANHASWQDLGDKAFPNVFASVAFENQTGSLSFDLATDDIPTGDYILCDLITIVQPSVGATMDYHVTYQGRNPTLNDLCAGRSNVPTSAEANTSAVTLAISNQSPGTPSPVIHVVTGTPVHVEVTVTPGSITGVQVSVGLYNGDGSEAPYAPGDTFAVNGGNNDAIGTILTVDSQGRILTFSFTGGTGYGDFGASDATTQTGTGTGLRVIFHASAGVITSLVIETFGGAGALQGSTFNPADNTQATLSATTVDANGAVLTIGIDDPGQGYSPSTNVATVNGGGDNALRIDILSVDTRNFLYDYRANLLRIH